MWDATLEEESELQERETGVDVQAQMDTASLSAFMHSDLANAHGPSVPALSLAPTGKSAPVDLSLPKPEPGGKPPRVPKVLTPEQQAARDAKSLLKSIGDQMLEASSWGPKMVAAGTPQGLRESMEATLAVNIDQLKHAHGNLTTLVASGLPIAPEKLIEIKKAKLDYEAVRKHAQVLAQKPHEPKPKGKSKPSGKAAATAS